MTSPAELRALLLSPEDAAALDAPGTTDAAVLIPLYLDRGSLHAVFTKRRDDLRRHAGEISFPGGRQDFPDEDLRTTALREAEEEIGLGRDAVSVIGYLDSYRTRTGYLIAPVVAVVAKDFTPVRDEREVASVFEVPLAFLMDPAHHLTHEREWRGQTRRFYAMPWGNRYIWGATAGMLKNLYDRVYGA